MRRPALLFAVAGLFTLAYAAARLAGWAEHTSAIAGMPRAASSLVLGPVFVVLHLVTVVVVPVLAIAAMLDVLHALRRGTLDRR